MKKILFYSSQIMLLLGSVIVGVVSSGELMILCASCLISSMFLMLAYAVSKKDRWPQFFLTLSVLLLHGYYLGAYSGFGKWLFVGMLASMIASLILLYMQFRTGVPIGITLESAAFAKGAILPEVLINTILSKTAGVQIFAAFSWVLLAYTSIFVILCAVLLYRGKTISGSWALACSLLEFFFVTDVAGAIILRILQAKEKAKNEKVPAKENKLLQSSAFSGKHAGKIHRG